MDSLDAKEPKQATDNLASVANTRKRFVAREEFDRLRARVEIIEKHLGIKPQS